jgi:hypothetical protein
MSPRRFDLLLGVIFMAPISVMAQPSADDKSLTLEQYRELGIASADRIWGASEYAEALEGLSTISRDALPRFGSRRSGALFARMISTENLLPVGGVQQVIDSGRQAVVAHSRRLSAYCASAPALMMLYLDQKSTGVQRHSPEVVRLALFSVRILRPMYDLVGAMLKGKSAEFLQSSTVVSARTSMRNDLNKSLIALVEMIEDEAHYRAADLEFLADGALRELPGLQKQLSVEQRAGLRARIMSTSRKHSNPRVRESLAGILAALKN